MEYLFENPLYCCTVTMKAVLVLFAVLASLYTYSEACTYRPQHPQGHVSNADFGKILPVY